MPEPRVGGSDIAGGIGNGGRFGRGGATTLSEFASDGVMFVRSGAIAGTVEELLRAGGATEGAMVCVEKEGAGKNLCCCGLVCSKGRYLCCGELVDELSSAGKYCAVCAWQIGFELAKPTATSAISEKVCRCMN